MGKSIKLYKALVVNSVVRKQNSNDLCKKILRITDENITDGSGFNTPETLNKFSEFIALKQRGYYCYQNDECIFRAWVFDNIERCYVGQDFLYNLKPNQLFIAWCETDPNSRRLGALNFSLNYISNELNGNELIAYIAPDNLASVKGFNKSGYESFDKFLLFVFFRLKMSFQYLKKGKKCFKIGIGHLLNK